MNQAAAVTIAKRVAVYPLKPVRQSVEEADMLNELIKTTSETTGLDESQARQLSLIHI